ncbi:tyrosine-type recombinase/integrase [Vibrio parahaemolyticus]|nr:tyrosine-type recombinase/integrase [Vibrio parahaemolyticus]
MNSAIYRDILNCWWNSLTDLQKKNVPTSKNTIDLRHLFDDSPISYYAVRQLIKEDINKIERELTQLGVLRNTDEAVIELLMRELISECKAKPDILWDVELSNKIGYSHLGSDNLDNLLEKVGLISKTYLANKLSCYKKVLDKPVFLDLRAKLNQLLLEHGVSLPYSRIKNSSHSVGYDLNHRRIFLKWEKSLTKAEKLALPIWGSAIDKLACSHLIPPERFKGSQPLLMSEFQRFSSEVFKLKGITYKTVKERDEERSEFSLIKEESKTSSFKKLRHRSVSYIEESFSKKGDYEGVQHTFAIGSLKVTSPSGVRNYQIACSHYCKFLESKGITGDSCFKDCFDMWSLRDFKEYLGEIISNGEMSTSSANTILSAARVTLNKIKLIRGFEFYYYPADGFEIVRESVAYKPYSPNERKQIHKMLEQEMALARGKLAPYLKLDRISANLDDPKIQARIIFEDDCNCIPIHYDEKVTRKGHDKLLHFIASRRLSLPELYSDWGVITRRVKAREIGVYVLKMAQVLGMNLNPILDLELDDYQEHHPLTNKPCLTYWKERSTGEKMLHLDLFQADLQWLTISQKNFVKTVFDEVTLLTSEARKQVSPELSQRLFITFETLPKAMNEKSMSNLYSELIDKYQLKNDDGEPLVLTTTRFRPTLVSELVEAGISLREIQYLLGHSSIYTTMNYLERLDFDRVIKDKARKSIEDIYSNAATSIDKPSSKPKRRFDETQIIMKTPLGGCKNLFDPPDFIKNSPLYVNGKPCSQYNKCLSCDNVMLTEKHLPDLFAMQRDYLATLERGEVINTPYHIVVLENLSLLDDILNNETSEFEDDVLMRAKEDSLFIETTILDSWGR